MIARSRSSRRVIVAHAHDRAINGHRSDTRMRRPTVYKPRRAPPTIGRPVVLLPMAEGATAAFGRAKGAPAPLSGGWAEQYRHAVRNNIVTTEKRELKQRKSVDTLPDSRPGHSSFQLITPTLVRRTSESRSIRLQ